VLYHNLFSIYFGCYFVHSVKAGGTYIEPLLKRVEICANYFVAISHVGLLFTVF